MYGCMGAQHIEYAQNIEKNKTFFKTIESNIN